MWKAVAFGSAAALVAKGAGITSLGGYTGAVAVLLVVAVVAAMKAHLSIKTGSKDSDGSSKEYAQLYEADADARKADYMKLVNHYYDLSTDFYEFGWGSSFHFGRRFKGETHAQSLARHEQWLSSKAGFKPGQKVLDIGCGIGGPMRAIARFSGAQIIGVNNNEYQIRRGTIKNQQEGLADLCSFRKTDFMNLPFEDGSIDGAYAIEATCHAPDKVACFREIFRTLKPGGVFVGYEWCMTAKYDPKNAEHRRIKHDIEEADGLPDLAMTWDVDQALKDAGFTLEEAYDISVPDSANPVPWYADFDADGLVNGLKHWHATKLGIQITHYFCMLLEALRLAPKGTTRTHAVLAKAPGAMVPGGKTEIFTPMYYFKAVKPLHA